MGRGRHLQSVKEMPLRFKLGTGGSAGIHISQKHAGTSGTISLNCLSNCNCNVKAFLWRNAFLLLTVAAIII
ncbi:hypothetical protein INR49_013187, partial [Caranx melampygus]